MVIYLPDAFCVLCLNQQVYTMHILMRLKPFYYSNQDSWKAANRSRKDNTTLFTLV